MFVAYDQSSGFDDHSNFVLRNSEIGGAADWFYIEGNLEGFNVENNVFTGFGGDPMAQNDKHADAFQIAEVSKNSPTRGTLTIRGNYFATLTPF